MSRYVALEVSVQITNKRKKNTFPSPPTPSDTPSFPCESDIFFCQCSLHKNNNIFGLGSLGTTEEENRHLAHPGPGAKEKVQIWLRPHVIYNFKSVGFMID